MSSVKAVSSVVQIERLCARLLTTKRRSDEGNEEKPKCAAREGAKTRRRGTFSSVVLPLSKLV